jgi:hypothetical protein
MTNLENYQAPEEIKRWGMIALGVGAVATIAWAVGTYMNVEQGLRSWLLGFIFWGGIGIGSLGLLMLQYLTGGAWGVVGRRFFEAGARTWPLIAIMFLPLAVGVKSLYEFTHMAADDPLVLHRGWYMDWKWWIVRAFVYIALFALLSALLNKWSANQDKAEGYEATNGWLAKASRFCGPTLVIYALVVTFAVVDWMMILDPRWFSTIWGLLFVAGWALSCLSFMITVLAALADKAPMNRILGKRHFHDLGKLMLALVMVWAYFNFSQFLIIWSGNLPEETTWYIRRMHGGWGVIGVGLVILHFAFPFLVLLQQDFKRKWKWLAILATMLLFMRIVDMYYMIGPSNRVTTANSGIDPASFVSSFSWLDIVAPVAIGGIWIWFFFTQLIKRPLVPVNDPYLENAIHHGRGH